MNPAFAAERRFFRVVFFAIVSVLGLSCAGRLAQSSSAAPPNATSVEGTVRSADGQAVVGVSVVLQRPGVTASTESKTDARGAFSFPQVPFGAYTVTARKLGWRDRPPIPVNVAEGEKRRIDLVLEHATTPASAGAIQFDDKPNFTVAGVTDWNNVSIHGSDTSVRTGEALARETAALKVEGPSSANLSAEKDLRAALTRAPGSFEANHRLGEFYCRAQRFPEALPYLESAEKIDPGNPGNAYSLGVAYLGAGDAGRARKTVQAVLKKKEHPDAHRLLGDIAEKLGDPLEAVREYERAAYLDPDELNYFAWGTELLLHRADHPAVEVFMKGSTAHPDSARLLEGLGAALSASGAYEEAAKRLCQAADLHPVDRTPYLFLGTIERAATMPLPCAEPALERFAHNQPDNAPANYYLAIALWKRQRGEELNGTARVEALLEKAVAIDPKFGEAYLQLGIVRAARGHFEDAIRDYEKAAEVAPQLGEAHYRLGLAYRRQGDESSAKREFEFYEQGQKMETAAIERQRREVRQFLIVLRDTAPSTPQ